MRVSCLQENLAKGLSIVGRAVAPRSTLPVLGNVLLATDNGRLRLAATNLEIGITCWIRAKWRNGAITVPARTFIDLVHALPSGPRRYGTGGAHPNAQRARGRFENHIKGVDAGFPSSRASKKTARSRSPDVLKKLIEQVAFAATTDRPILTNVLANLARTARLRRRRRLPAVGRAALTPVSKPIEVIIPARAGRAGSRIRRQKDPIGILFPPQRSRVLFHLSNVELVSQLIDGKFPDNAIVPKATRHEP
jgi:DNA polymerase-3 subunit beta